MWYGSAYRRTLNRPRAPVEYCEQVCSAQEAYPTTCTDGAQYNKRRKRLSLIYVVDAEGDRPSGPKELLGDASAAVLRLVSRDLDRGGVRHSLARAAE